MNRARIILVWVARLAVAGMFIGACLAKIAAPESFALAVHRYRLLPDLLVNAVALLLPWLELLCGAAVLVGPPRWRAAGALWIALLLVVFTGAISLNMLRGIEASCGCFSTRADAAVSDGWNLARNVTLLGLTLVILWDARRRDRPAAAGEPAP